METNKTSDESDFNYIDKDEKIITLVSYRKREGNKNQITEGEKMTEDTKIDL